MKFVKLLCLMIMTGCAAILAPGMLAPRNAHPPGSGVVSAAEINAQGRLEKPNAAGLSPILTGRAFPKDIPMGPGLLEPGQYYKIGGGRSSSISYDFYPPDPVKFFLVNSAEYRGGESEEDMLNRLLRENRRSHVWDNKWYYYVLPRDASITLYAVRGTFNRDGSANWSRFSYISAAVLNLRKWTACPQGKNSCVELSTNQPYKIKGFGGGVQFSFMNPPNENGFTGDHIMYSFGY